MSAGIPRRRSAGTFYEGGVMHARLKPFSHRFSYRVFSTLIDIDRLPALGRLSSLFSVNRSISFIS